MYLVGEELPKNHRKCNCAYGIAEHNLIPNSPEEKTAVSSVKDKFMYSMFNYAYHDES